MLLTNGTLLDLEFVRTCADSGLSRIVLHIDSHQNRFDYSGEKTEQKLNELRSKYLNFCDSAGIYTTLGLTLYKDNLEGFHKVIEFSKKRTGLLQGILATNYFHDEESKNFSTGFSAHGKKLSMTNRDVLKFMREKENAYPVFYLPSTKSEKSLRWLFYIMAVTAYNKEESACLYLSPRYKMVLSLFLFLKKKFRKHFGYGKPAGTQEVIILLLLYGLISFSPGNFFSVMKFLLVSALNKNLRLITIIFQDEPIFMEDGSLDCCKNCPDATVRNNKLIPVCRADYISPLKSKGD